jgi:hypothetical protein
MDFPEAGKIIGDLHRAAVMPNPGQKIGKFHRLRQARIQPLPWPMSTVRENHVVRLGLNNWNSEIKIPDSQQTRLVQTSQVEECTGAMPCIVRRVSLTMLSLHVVACSAIHWPSRLLGMTR